MTRLPAACRVLLTLMLALVAVNAHSGDGASVAGSWDLRVETSAGTGTPTLVLEQDGSKLTGIYTGRFGPQPLTGNIDGDQINFAFDVSGPMGSAKVVYSGTVDGDTMSGTMQMGAMAGGTFSGRRQ
jgi:hypothetical protein